MTQQGSDQGPAPGTLTITDSLIKSRGTATTEVHQIVGSDINNGTDAVAIRITPTAGVVDNGDSTYTFSKPLFVAGEKTYYAIASAGGYPDASKIIIIPTQGEVAQATAELAVSPPTENTISVTFLFTFVGVVTYLLDGVNQGGASSPLIVFKNSAGGNPIAVRIHCVGDDGKVLNFDYTLPPQATASGGSTPGTATSGGYGFASSAEFDAFRALVEAIRTTLVGLKEMS